MSKYPKYILRRVSVNTTGPIYYQRYSSYDATVDAYRSARDEGDTAEILQYCTVDEQAPEEDRGIYYGEYRIYSVPHEMIFDCTDRERVMIRMHID